MLATQQARLRHPLGAGRGHERHAELVQHVGADHADLASQRLPAQHHQRYPDVRQKVQELGEAERLIDVLQREQPAGHEAEPAERQEDQDEREQEVGYRHHEEGDEAEQVVEQ